MYRYFIEMDKEGSNTLPKIQVRYGKKHNRMYNFDHFILGYKLMMKGPKFTDHELSSILNSHVNSKGDVDYTAFLSGVINSKEVEAERELEKAFQQMTSVINNLINLMN
jgi:Ca2+-binding EF-hand superfamily protein